MNDLQALLQVATWQVDKKQNHLTKTCLGSIHCNTLHVNSQPRSMNEAMLYLSQMLAKKHRWQQLASYLIWIRTILVRHHLCHSMTYKCYLKRSTESLTQWHSLQKVMGTFPLHSLQHRQKIRKPTLMYQAWQFIQSSLLLCWAGPPLLYCCFPSL